MLRVSGIRFPLSTLRISGFGLRFQRLVFGVSHLVLNVSSNRLRGLGFGGQGVGFETLGFRFGLRVPACEACDFRSRGAPSGQRSFVFRGLCLGFRVSGLMFLTEFFRVSGHTI